MGGGTGEEGVGMCIAEERDQREVSSGEGGARSGFQANSGKASG